MQSIRHFSTAAPVLDSGDDFPVMVLLVDDQPIVGETIRRMLANHPNIDFHYCPSAQEAPTIAREILPTVILQDLAMPGVNGLDLVQQYRADPATAHIPIIVLSATEMPAVKREAFEAGANDYLVKVPDEIELVARLRHHTRAYLTQLQRDDAYRALRESQQQLMEMNFELQRLSNLDALTGLSNRRYFDQQIEAGWIRAGQRQSWLSLLMVDVDRFKELNDILGHRTGDEVLKAVATTIDRAFPAAACVARYGGDEFAILLEDLNPEEIHIRAAALCKAVEAAHEQMPPSAGVVTVSVGGDTRIPTADTTFAALIDAADNAMYSAKRHGRNRAEFPRL